METLANDLKLAEFFSDYLIISQIWLSNKFH